MRTMIGMADWHFYIAVGRVGFTAGPSFLSLDLDGDIAVQVISPKDPMSQPKASWGFEFDTSKPRGTRFRVFSDNETEAA